LVKEDWGKFDFFLSVSFCFFLESLGGRFVLRPRALLPNRCCTTTDTTAATTTTTTTVTKSPRERKTKLLERDLNDDDDQLDLQLDDLLAKKCLLAPKARRRAAPTTQPRASLLITIHKATRPTQPS
jgi:hypothetical protein